MHHIFGNVIQSYLDWDTLPFVCRGAMVSLVYYILPVYYAI